MNGHITCVKSGHWQWLLPKNSISPASMARRRAVITRMRSDQTNFTIRRAGLEDAPALSLIGQATFLESYYMDVGRDDMIAHLKATYSERYLESYLQEPRVAIWLAEFEPTLAPIGFAAVCTPELSIETKATDLQLLHIYVLSSFYGAKVGPALMETAIAFARAQRAERLVLGVWPENHRALAFYRRNGFEKIGSYPCQVGARVYEDLVLAKTLGCPVKFSIK